MVCVPRDLPSLGRAPLGDQRDRLAPQRVLQPVADEPGTSRPTRTGSLPTRVSSATTRSAGIWGGARWSYTLTTGIRSGGFQSVSQCSAAVSTHVR